MPWLAVTFFTHNRTRVPFQVVRGAAATVTNAMASGDLFHNRTGVPFQVVCGAAATMMNVSTSGDLFHNRTGVHDCFLVDLRSATVGGIRVMMATTNAMQIKCVYGRQSKKCQ